MAAPTAAAPSSSSGHSGAPTSAAGRSGIAVMGMKPGRTVGRADDGHRTAVIGMTGVDRLGAIGPWGPCSSTAPSTP